jgi:hypothetical protein
MDSSRRTRKARKSNDEKKQILEDKKVYYKSYYQNNKSKIQQSVKDNIYYAKMLIDELNKGNKKLKNVRPATIKKYNITFDSRNKKYIIENM